MRILIAMDESDYSIKAAEEVSRSMRHEDSSVLLLHVLEPAEFFEPDQSVWSREEQAQVFLKRASALLQSAEFKKIEIRVAKGEAPKKIVEIAREWNADFAVLGSHGRTSLASALLGSVSESVARQAGCSVVIVRKTERSGQEK